MSLPLEGIRVVDLGQIYAAPYCTLQMAYLGAEIIKVEPPGTGEFLRLPEFSPGGVSYAFLMLNANKKSITLNLKDARGRELLMRLLEDADVMVENYAPGMMESFGLDHQSLAPRFPRLVYASAKGYGSDSRWAKLGAMDSTVQASSGFMSVTGYADRPGVKTPTTFIDMGTGIHLVAGILAALMQRGRTGRGQKVEVMMHDVAIPALTSLLAPVLEGHKVGRLGNRHRGACPCNVYPAADGDVMIFCLTEAHWRTIARLIGYQELVNDPAYKSPVARMKNVDRIDEMMAAWTRTLARDSIIAQLTEDGVPCSPVRAVAEVAADPELEQRDMLRKSDFPTRGDIKVIGPAMKLSEVTANGRRTTRPPVLGEHTSEVLARLGVDAAELARLRQDGVI